MWGGGGGEQVHQCPNIPGFPVSHMTYACAAEPHCAEPVVAQKSSHGRQHTNGSKKCAEPVVAQKSSHGRQHTNGSKK